MPDPPESLLRAELSNACDVIEAVCTENLYHPVWIALVGWYRLLGREADAVELERRIQRAHAHPAISG